MNSQRRAADNDTLLTFLLADMPEHEDVAATNRYRSSILFLRASGFKDTLRKDGTGTTIKYFGDKSTPLAVGEMALLRAAELAQKSGKQAFLIWDRSDYRMTSTPTMYGSPIGPTVTAGYGSQIEVDFLDSISVDNDRAIDAAALRGALEPIYIRADTTGSQPFRLQAACRTFANGLRPSHVCMFAAMRRSPVRWRRSSSTAATTVSCPIQIAVIVRRSVDT
jgi:hypothetical protein